MPALTNIYLPNVEYPDLFRSGDIHMTRPDGPVSLPTCRVDGMERNAIIARVKMPPRRTL